MGWECSGLWALGCVASGRTPYHSPGDECALSEQWAGLLPEPTSLKAAAAVARRLHPASSVRGLKLSPGTC